MNRRNGRPWALALALLGACSAFAACRAAEAPHNIILFVADGLRSAAVTPQTAPAFAVVRDEGVNFQNSHSVYPTVTTVNASALATGHLPGDTGNFGNKLYVGAEPFGLPVNGLIAPMEDEEALGLMNQRFGGNYLGATTLLQAARRQGWSTAAIGKLGPIAIQDVTARGGETLVVDDDTGFKDPGLRGLPLPADVLADMKAAGLELVARDRGLNQSSGAYNLPGVKVPNSYQQDWFTDVATKVVLPRFKAAGKPFAMVFWSRDPDGTQHNEGDSLNQLSPGINGPTSLAAVRNASDDLQRLRDALKALGLDQTTDIVVVADHGFSTTSKQSATSAAAKLSYRTVQPGFLPPGFLAIDLSKALGLPLWDGSGLDIDLSLHIAPASGNYLLGRDAKAPDVVIAANGGSDLIYLPGAGAKALAAKLVESLAREDYVSALFVDDALGPIPGALPLSAIRLVGSARTPRPSIIVSFKSWDLGCPDPELCAVEVADTELQQGQGIHGAFSRADTHNFMAAIGPDFRAGFLDPAPVGNADIAPTLARIMGLSLDGGGLIGRVLEEALKDGQPAAASAQTLRSEPGPGGFVTVLNLQTAGSTPYFDAAGAPGRTVGLKP
jgi:arylsulfatase A-like enzyme